MTSARGRLRMSPMDTRTELLPRQIADAHLTEYTGLDPVSGVFLGIEGSEVALPDFSPPGRTPSPGSRAPR